LLKEIPVEAHDMAMHYIITETQILSFEERN